MYISVHWGLQFREVHGCFVCYGGRNAQIKHSEQDAKQKKRKSKTRQNGEENGEINKEDRDGEIGIKKASDRSTEEMREQAQVVEVSFDAIEQCRQHSSSCFSHSNRKALFFFYKPVSCPTESYPLLKPHSDPEEPGVICDEPS